MNFSREPSDLFLSATSTTLLRNLCDDRCPERFEAAWRDFYQKYVTVIVRWCEWRWRMVPADADDVAAEVLIKVLKNIHGFQYRRGGNFRAWLLTVTRRAMIDYWRSEQRLRCTGHGTELDSVQAREELLERLQAEFDLELLAEARRRVENKVSPRDWAIFVALTEQGQTPRQIADELGMTRNHIDTIKERVLHRLRRQVRHLEQHGIPS